MKNEYEKWIKNETIEIQRLENSRVENRLHLSV